MRGANAPGRAAGAAQRFVHDLADGARASATLGVAAETAIDLASGARRCRMDGAAHLMVAQYVAGTDDHRTSSDCE